MRKVFNIGLLFALLVFSANTATAQQVIAYADVDSIVTSMAEYKAAQADIQSFVTKTQEQLKLKEQQIAAYVQNIQANIENYSINQQKEEEAKIAKMQQDLQAQANDAQTKMAQREQEKMGEIYDKFNKAIEAVAQEKGYTYIMDMKAFLYKDGQGAIDATADIKAKLGIQ